MTHEFVRTKVPTAPDEVKESPLSRGRVVSVGHLAGGCTQSNRIMGPAGRGWRQGGGILGACEVMWKEHIKVPLVQTTS